MPNARLAFLLAACLFARGGGGGGGGHSGHISRGWGGLHLGMTIHNAVQRFRGKPLSSSGGSLGQPGSGSAGSPPGASSGGQLGGSNSGTAGQRPSNSGSAGRGPSNSGSTFAGGPPSQGTAVMHLPGAKGPNGGGPVVGHFRNGRLHRIVWNLPPGAEPPVDWDELLKRYRKRYGDPQLRKERRTNRVRDIAEWSDGLTTLAYIRDPLPLGPLYYGVLQEHDSPPVPSSTEAASGISKTSFDCSDFKTCFEGARHAAIDGRCGDAIELYTKALGFKQDPWSYFDRAILKRAVADENGAQDDFKSSQEHKAGAPDFNQTKLLTPDEWYGPAWSCL